MSELDMRKECKPSEDLNCRLCLQKSINMLDIFKIFYKSSISEKIKSCLNISLTEQKINYYNFICETCLFNLEMCIEFKRKCEESERHFIKSVRSKKINISKVLQNAIKRNKNKERNKLENGLQRIDIHSEKFHDNNTISHDFRDIANNSEKSNKKYYNDIILDSALKSDISIAKSKDSKVIGKKMENTELLKCNTCNTQCQSKYVLKVHMRTHSGERPFQCNICEKRFVSKSNMNMHKKLTHTEEKQVCSECGKSFSCLTYLKRHMVTHFDVKPYGCELCERRFTTKSYLKEHIARHKGDKRFFCEVCGLKFISDVNLKQHLMVHGIETGRFKRHQCPHCLYRTQGRVDLARHIRTHTGERPFHCEFGECQAAFAGKGTLREHLRTHSGERPYACSECPARFSRSDKCKNHLLKKHNIIKFSSIKRSKLALELSTIEHAEADVKDDSRLSNNAHRQYET